MPGLATSVMWFRRDLRLQDHPALAAAADAGRVVALLALDDALRRAVGSSTAGPFRVFPPFYRMWLAYGRPAPADSDPARISWRRGIGGTGVPQDPRLPARLILPDAGELAAYAAWHRFRQDGLRRYSDDRDRPDLDHTSRLSVYLKFGAIHPRTLLADLGEQGETFRRELVSGLTSAIRSCRPPLRRARPGAA